MKRMKSKAGSIMCLVFLVLVGCGIAVTHTDAKAKQDNLLKISDNPTKGHGIYVFTDSTGLQYLCVYTESGVTITPRMTPGGAQMKAN